MSLTSKRALCDRHLLINEERIKIITDKKKKTKKIAARKKSRSFFQRLRTDLDSDLAEPFFSLKPTKVNVNTILRNTRESELRAICDWEKHSRDKYFSINKQVKQVCTVLTFRLFSSITSKFFFLSFLIASDCGGIDVTSTERFYSNSAPSSQIRGAQYRKLRSFVTCFEALFPRNFKLVKEVFKMFSKHFFVFFFFH